jgi:hypothetical protein
MVSCRPGWRLTGRTAAAMDIFQDGTVRFPETGIIPKRNIEKRERAAGARHKGTGRPWGGNSLRIINAESTIADTIRISACPTVRQLHPSIQGRAAEAT